MLLAGLAVALVAVVIYALTGAFRPSPGSSVRAQEQRIAETVDEVLRSIGSGGGLVPQATARSRAASPVLLELLTRLGLDRPRAVDHLCRLGYPTPDGAPAAAAPPQGGLAVHDARAEVADAVERALLVGIEVARCDDDYARVGDEYLDAASLQERADRAEVVLFGTGSRERYSVLSKASIVLQDMAQAGPTEEARTLIGALQAAFDERLGALQKEMAQAMSDVPDPDALRWGDSRDRRMYYFKMGVTNSLRRSTRLQSLGHLYLRKGVDYDVVEAYDLAADECRPLAHADLLGIDRLIEMGPLEVRGLVRGALPRSGRRA